MINNDETKQYLIDKMLNIPTRIVQVNGQNYKYVKLADVLDILHCSAGVNIRQS